MAIEIERKFLINPKEKVPFHLFGVSEVLRQGYILIGKGKHLRIRLYPNDTAVLGIKYINGPVREEFEYEIPYVEGVIILNKCEYRLGKVRRSGIIGNEHYDLDVYPNKVRVVEVEFESLEASKDWDKPEWIGKEITGVKKYSNITLAKQKLEF